MATAKFSDFTPYASSAELYLGLGWWPLPLLGKGRGRGAAVPKDYTGYEGKPVMAEDVAHWADEKGDFNVALRFSKDICGIDVDCYDDKQGAASLAELEKKYGALPPAWTSTSREDGSKVRVYRKPASIKLPGKAGPGIEIIQFHHRYMVAWPSQHPDTGKQYHWYNPEGKRAAPPRLEDLTDLPAAWYEMKALPSAAASSASGERERDTSYTDPDIYLLLATGIPYGENQDEILRDVVWKLKLMGRADSEIQTIWQGVVDKTPLTRPEDPWTDEDFQRHLGGAREKLAEQEIFEINPEDIPVWDGSPPDPGKSGLGEPSFWANMMLGSMINRATMKINYSEADRFIPRSDLMSAQLFEKVYAGSLTYQESTKQWRLWDGTAHVTVDEAVPATLIQNYAQGLRIVMQLLKSQYMAQQLAALGGDKEAALDSYLKRWRKHRDYRDSLWNDPRQANLLRQLKKTTRLVVGEGYFAITPDTALLLNFDNGTFDVSEGKLREHRLEDKLTFVIRRKLDMDLADKQLGEVAPKFAGLLSRMCGAPGELSVTRHQGRMRAVWRWLGFQCHGSNPEKKMAIFEGEHDIGKNQVMEIIADLLGPDLAYTSASAKLLVKIKMDRHDSVSNALIGKRIVLVNELSKNQVLDEQQILTLVNPSGTQVDLRQLHHDAVHTPITWKITVTTNELARADLTPQMLRRLLIFPLSGVEVPPEQQYDIKRAVLDHEADGVLAHLVREWHAWYQGWMSGATGLLVPADSIARLAAYQEENEHPAEQFVAERCELETGAFISHTAIWRMCAAYYKDQHADVPPRYTGGRRKLFAVLDETPGVERTSQPNGRLKGFEGIKMLPPEEGSAEQVTVWGSMFTR